jgi:hypothetical protein
LTLANAEGNTEDEQDGEWKASEPRIFSLGIFEKITKTQEF